MFATVATNYELHLKRGLFPKGALFWLVKFTLFTFLITARRSCIRLVCISNDVVDAIPYFAYPAQVVYHDPYPVPATKCSHHLP